MRSVSAILLFVAAHLFGSPLAHAQLELKPGDHICLVGNELGERMQHHNYWEASLHQAFPQHQLAVRNLCFPGDEPFERIRSQNFGNPDKHLTHSGATVILYFFGFNESFEGDDGLAKFEEQMIRLVQETGRKTYGGGAPPRIVLISPIAFENTGDPNLPDGIEHNARLKKYTAVLESVALATGVSFADVFSPTLALFQERDARLTLNGAHLNDDGYKAFAPILLRAITGKDAAGPITAELKQEVDDKSFHWWHRYRAVNGFSIYGKRGEAGMDGAGKYRNRDVMEREREILDQMTANRDARIWQLAQGKTVAANADDSNTLPFLDVKTNVGQPDDPNVKAGKLGSLDYLTAAEQQKLFKLPDGFEIQLVASEEQFPELANPVALNFDNKGRLWVSVMPSYPHWQPKSEMNDKVLILEDHDGDGRTDECKIFADGLHQPTGFEFGRGGVWVAQQPDILFLQDTDGDDKADTRIRRLVGFDTADSHHGLAAFEWGPDGALYFQEGTFKYSQVESPWGLTRMHEAGVWRYDPTTEQFGVHVSLPFANPWGHVYDYWGQDFVSDASPGQNYWATPISGNVKYPAKHAGGSFNDGVNNFKDTALRGRNVYPTFIVKRTRPSAGSELIYSSHFPDDMQGDFLLTNVIGDRSILQHGMQEKDSGFLGIEKTPLVDGDDGNFRPVDVQIGPDGALYIVDWHNALIGHLQHNLRDPSRDHSHGRIWRVICKDRPLLKPAVVAGQPIPALLELLKSHEGRVRYVTRRELAERPAAEVSAAVARWLADLPQDDADFEHHRLEALWALQTQNLLDLDLLTSVLNSPDYHARAAATRVLCGMRDKIPDALTLVKERCNDKNARVRLEAVRACSFFDSEDAIEVALEVLNHDIDDYLQYTLDETMRHLESVL
jgi:putative membrane-bound dehydrogenase-like protein